MGYVMRNCTKEKLENSGFRYSGLLSSQYETFYTYRFIVYRYRGVPTLEAEFATKLEDGETHIGVYHVKTRERYASWYLQGTLGFDGENLVVDDINKIIEKKKKKLKIEEVE